MEEKIYKSIHEILARSYFVFFLFVILGILASFFVVQKLFFENQNELGFGLLVLGTMLVFWSQFSSRKTKPKRGHKDKEVSKQGFAHGPYKFSRSPTHLGLLLLALGFSVLDNSSVVAFFSILGFVFVKLIFIKKEEHMLYKKYGDVYLEYKNKVKL